MGSVLRFLEACTQKIYAQYVTEIGQGYEARVLARKRISRGNSQIFGRSKQRPYDKLCFGWGEIMLHSCINYPPINLEIRL